MAKLSRTNKYQQLRDQLDEETTAAQSVSAPQIKLTRSSTPSTSHAKSSAALLDQVLESPQSGVIDELVGEVKQYNIDNGDRAAEDTQINILRTLDEDATAIQKRRRHLETMEANQDHGGTTMNMNAINIETVVNSAPKMAENKKAEDTKEEKIAPREITLEESLVLGKKGLQADDEIDEDNLELFDLGVDDFDQTARNSVSNPKAPAKKRNQPKPAEKKVEKAAEKPVKKKKAKPVPAQVADLSNQAMAEEEEEKGGKAGNIIMIVLILLLLGAIGYTIYLISKIGIL